MRGFLLSYRMLNRGTDARIAPIYDGLKTRHSRQNSFTGIVMSLRHAHRHLIFLTAGLIALTGCQTTPSGATGPGKFYAVQSSHNGFAGTQQLRFGPYRVDTRFEAGPLASSNVKRGLLGALLGCKNDGCGMPRSPVEMPLDFTFSGPEGVSKGHCAPRGDTFQCDLDEVRMQFESVIGALGYWTAQTPFGPLRIESRDIADQAERRIEWRVIDGNQQTLSMISDTLQKGDSPRPSFSIWIAEGHPDDHQALAKVTATLLAYAWHASGT